jgi:hypothetical protein
MKYARSAAPFLATPIHPVPEVQVFGVTSIWGHKYLGSGLTFYIFSMGRLYLNQNNVTSIWGQALRFTFSPWEGCISTRIMSGVMPDPGAFVAVLLVERLNQIRTLSEMTTGDFLK